ncbi:sensor histidine kinase [Corynebacterium sp. A21]|uniref:sensor histidine kinase n=1 Tax=Corynebacterium sp. A21 TaxID=3457318 RepID=UPI003FD0F12E
MRTRTNRRPGARTFILTHWEYIFTTALALILFSVAWPTFGETHAAPLILWPLLSALATLPLILSPRYPEWAWAAISVACVLAVPLRSAAGFELGWPVTSHLALTFALIWVLSRGQLRQIGWVVGMSMALMLFNPSADSRIGWAVGVAVFCAFLLLIRWLRTSRRQLASSTVELALKAELFAEEADLRIVAEERTRLVRDLHDVVAHQMSMVVVQAQSAPYRLQNVTPAIHAEFDAIADTARSALDEVRSMLGVLRTDSETGSTAPVGANQIMPTLTNARRSGVDITWSIQGNLHDIDETAGIVLHRILQESLSNAMRHAPGSKVLVTLNVAAESGTPGQVARLEVANGAASEGELPVPETGGGSGIQGMGARARAVGGSFSANPEADGGFTVIVDVPLRQRA